MNELEIVEGDTLPIITGKITKDDGTDEDITGWEIELRIGYDTPVTKAASIPIGTDGYFEFPWEEGDLQEGYWPAEVSITSPAGTQTFQRTHADEPLRLRIRPRI